MIRYLGNSSLNSKNFENTPYYKMQQPYYLVFSGHHWQPGAEILYPDQPSPSRINYLFPMPVVPGGQLADLGYLSGSLNTIVGLGPVIPYLKKTCPEVT